MSAAPPAAVARLVVTVRRSFDGGAWHGPSVAESLAGCTAAEAAARPIPGAHSVWELALHVAGWADEVADRVIGAPPGAPRGGDWPPVPEPADEAAWEAARTKVAAARGRLLSVIEALRDDQLGQMLPPSPAAAPGEARATLHDTIVGIAEHNAYHGGQIALLRRALRAARG